MTATPDLCTSPDSENTRLMVLPLLPADLPAISAMTARCSRDTIFHRFHGFIDLSTYLASLVHGEQSTVVAWSEAECIGFASLAPGRHGHDVGVLVEDRWQRRGVGVALLESLVSLAKGHDIDLLHADVLFEDSFSLRILARYGSMRVTLEHGEYSAFVQVAQTTVVESKGGNCDGTSGVARSRTE